MRNSVLSHIVQPVHHTATQYTAGDLHVTGNRPDPKLDIVVFNIRDVDEVVVAPYNKQAVINHRDAKVAAGLQHRGHVQPGVGVGILRLNSLQRRSSIETTYLHEEKRHLKMMKL